MTDKESVIKFWLTSSDDDFDTAEKLFESKKYHHALYFCQLAVEKYLKGLIVSRLDAPVKHTHDLILLSQQLDIDISSDHLEELRNITKFNLQARYDTIKREFYKKATHKYSKEWLKITKEVLLWLKKN
jgi:HEPN domain-containing protein